MEDKNEESTSAPGSTSTALEASARPATPAPVSMVRPRIAFPGSGALRPWNPASGVAEADRLARRYSREAQLAVEGLLYLGVRWPFKLMAALVDAGRKWEEESYRPIPKRRVPPYDDER